MKNIHFLNGKFVDEDHLLISPRDLGYSRGYAAFDFMLGNITLKDAKSNIDTHATPVKMFSGVCQSSANNNPLIRMPL